jgi:hypothetical protein
MLAAVHVSRAASYWTLDLVTTLLGLVLAFEARSVPKRWHEWWAARRLLKGRESEPGLPGVDPLGTRLMNLEVGHRKMVKDVGGIRESIGDMGLKLDHVYAELTTNHGSTVKDKVDVLFAACPIVAEQQGETP